VQLEPKSMGYLSYAVLTLLIGSAVALPKQVIFKLKRLLSSYSHFQQTSKDESELSNTSSQSDEPSNAIFESDEPSNAIFQSDEPSNAIFQSDEPSNAIFQTDKPFNAISQSQKPDSSFYIENSFFSNKINCRPRKTS
jgi:hypothetical protein